MIRKGPEIEGKISFVGWHIKCIELPFDAIGNENTRRQEWSFAHNVISSMTKGRNSAESAGSSFWLLKILPWKTRI
jgi:hypothetical protein